MSNLLQNPSFNNGVYQPSGQVSLVIPNGWRAGWLDNGKLWRCDENGAVSYGTYNPRGPRARSWMAKCLKPEVLQIEAVQPYLDPPRTEPPTNAVTGFKQWGTLCWWMFQSVPVVTGHSYIAGARAHAWARRGEDPGDPHYSYPVGTGLYHIIENGSNSDEIANYRFRIGVDLYGGINPFDPMVQYGIGIHIYNEFFNIPALEFAAQSSAVTFFVMVDNLFGFENSNAYLSRPFIEQESGQDLTEILARLAELEGQVDIAEDVLADHEARILVLEGVTPPPPPPPPPPTTVVYPRPKSMGGLHVEVVGSHNGYGQFLNDCNACGRPVGLIKAFFDGGALGEAKSVNPYTYTVWRGRPRDEDEDNPSGDWKWNPSQTPAIAKSWMDRLCDRWKLDRGVTDFLEITNEPNGAMQIQFENQRDFFLECMKYADTSENPFHIAIGGFSSGCPEEWQVDILAPAFKYAAEHGHIVATHDGSVNEDRRLFQQAYEDGTALRYRMFKQRMDALGYPMPYIAITECYWPDGYRGRNPYSDMEWYLAQLAQDPYVLGMAWFTLGDYDFGGGSVNVVGQLKNFRQSICRMPIVVQ